ncbi:unnamed protein product [Rhizoctonia solani]|uniref:Uncharacterized protein n=1 Tax=Rhizoctonia solani TaxID=456999 RepID=A0A8H3HXM9_9AGAM|nr:unnamed protein product [Rhizoctonia solani]
MPSYAGFYVTPNDWTDWMRTRSSLPPSPAIAKSLIEQEFRRLKVHKYLVVTMVPVPPSEPDERNYRRHLMVYRQWSEKREYLPPRADADHNGPAVLDQLMGLKVSEWRTHWHNEDSLDSPYEAEFLEPGTQEDAAEKRRRKQEV